MCARARVVLNGRKATCASLRWSLPRDWAAASLPLGPTMCTAANLKYNDIGAVPMSAPSPHKAAAASPTSAHGKASVSAAAPVAELEIPSFLMNPRMTPLLPFILIAAGCLHAVLQEELMEGMKGLPLIISSFEFGCCALLSLLWLCITGGDPRNVPVWTLLRISLLVLSSLVSGNVALRWVSYPIKVVVKSCKLLPTMALGALLLRKRYTLADQLAALLLCAGLVGFTLADHGGGTGTGKGSSPLGVGVLLFAVSCDAVQVRSRLDVASCSELRVGVRLLASDDFLMTL